MVDLIHELTARQFLDLRPGTRLVALHPGLVQRGLMISKLLQRENVVYLRFEGSDSTQADIERRLEAALEYQNSNLRAVELLILDECDRCVQDELAAVLENVCDQLVDGCVVVMSRKPLSSVMAREGLRAYTECIPREEQLMLHDYTQPNSKSLLEVQALGMGHVSLNGTPVTAWDGVLPRALFFYLVDRGMTTRNDIFETFWPNLTVREATNVFHVTKRKISEVLGMDLTSYWSGFYHISEDIELSYDVSHFNECVQQSAVRNGNDAIYQMRAADWLYRGNFLAGMEMKWVDDRRKELHITHGEVLASLAKMLERKGQAHEALGLYLRAYKTNRYREDIIFSVMKLYIELDMPQDALAVYEALHSALERDLGVQPEKSIQELAAETTLRVQ